AWVVVIENAGDRASSEYMHAIEAAAPSFGVQVIPAHVQDATEIARALDERAGDSYAGLIVLPGVFTAIHRDAIVALAAQHRLSAVFAARPSHPRAHRPRDPAATENGMSFPRHTMAGTS